MDLLKFSSKIADGLLHEGNCVDRPVGQPPKTKSLVDVTERKGRHVATPTPSNCSRTGEMGYWLVFQDKKSKFRFCKKGIIHISCMKCTVICVWLVKQMASTNFTTIRLSKWKGVTKERLFDVNSSNQNLCILKVTPDF